MKKVHVLIPLILLTCTLIQSCNQSSLFQDTVNDDVKNTKAAPIFTKSDGVLTVLMDNSLTSYFVFNGQPLGYEYEMLALFAEENDLNLEIKIINQVDHILDSLIAGNGDLVAANLSISRERMQNVNFSEPLFRTRQVLVQRLPNDYQKMTKDEIESSLIRDRLDLNNKDVFVRANSSYELILKNLISETGIDVGIHFGRGDLATEHLIELVSEGKIDYTICDENKAIIFNAYYDNIDIATPMSLSHPIAWAINKNATKLDSVLNNWINKRKGSLDFNLIANRYFEMTRREERFVAKEYDYIKNGNISDYDELIKKYASDLNWDWRLLTAQIYKESKFDPDSKSWKGAIGLMQLMPRTAESYGIQPNELVIPEKNIMAGTKHLSILEEQWKSILEDSLEVIKFTLGSYNVGKGHIDDAIRLAEKYGLSTNKWDDNVAKMLLNKSIPRYYKYPVVKYGYCRGIEPVNYVSSILDHYNLYSQFTE